eukprot:7538607-Ditylum_brightwellii.AAC.1
MGGQYAELQFGFDPGTNEIASEVIMMSSVGGLNELSTISEVPRTAGGAIMPLIRVEGQIDKTPFNFIMAGGWGFDWFEWNTDTALTPFSEPVDDFLRALDLSHVIVEVGAFDYDLFDEFEQAFWKDTETYFIDTIDEINSKFSKREYNGRRGFNGNTTVYGGASCLTCNRAFMIGATILLWLVSSNILF